LSNQTPKLNTFPVFFGVNGRRVVIFGGGDEALAKARLVAQSNAEVIISASKPGMALAEWARSNSVYIDTVTSAKSLIHGAALVFSATADERTDRAMVSLARSAGVPVNAVDRPELCDFYTPAIVNRAPVAIAIGTEGAGPVLAQMLRAQIERLLPQSLGRLATLASSYRGAAEKLMPRGAPRRQFWKRFFSGSVARAIEAGDLSCARRAATDLLNERGESGGHVALVGAGPGAEDLLTLRAHRLLMEADAIVHDALVPEAVVAMGRRDAERIAAGKRKGCHSRSQDEINKLLVSLAREGKHVVRLKSGDPLVFGRAGEEMQALRDAGIPYEIVPGITSALAAAADFELPATLRGVSSSLIFTTGHDLSGDVLPDWASLAMSGATVAVYMGRSVAADVAARLIEAGLSPDTAVAVVENASRGDKRLLHGVLADLPALASRCDLAGPVMTLIGDAVAGANFKHSNPLAANVPAEAAA
jgi:uroporphyrin-III C-methyltransferase/precorrin-2 dehydrogenase/sirohydrochlorin ferrochelatase